MNEQVAALQAGLAKIFKDGTYSDLTVKCGPLLFKVHKVILCAHSEYFEVACKEHRFNEGETSVITLKAVGDDVTAEEPICDDPDAIKLMIDFFYRLDYSLAPINDTNSSSQLDDFGQRRSSPISRRGKSMRMLSYSGRTLSDEHFLHAEDKKRQGSEMTMHAKVFAIACKYQVPALQKLAAEKFNRAAHADWQHDTFPEAVEIVFSWTPESLPDLRAIVCDICLKHGDLLDNPRMLEVIKSNKDLACELLVRKCGKPATYVWSKTQGQISHDQEVCDQCSGLRHNSRCNYCYRFIVKTCDCQDYCGFCGHDL